MTPPLKNTLMGLSMLSIFLLTSCGHKDVRPGLNNLHKVSLQAETKEQGAEQALRQAKRYCKKQKKRYFIVEEKSEYTGAMDETTYNTVRKLGKVAAVVGSGVRIDSDTDAGKNTGEAIGTAGVATDIMLGQNYKVDMQFKCE